MEHNYPNDIRREDAEKFSKQLSQILDDNTTAFLSPFCIACVVALIVTNGKADSVTILTFFLIGFVVSFIVRHTVKSWYDNPAGFFFLNGLYVALGVAAAIV